MKQILLAGPYPPPFGGIASLVVELAPFLASNGYGVTVVMPSFAPEQRSRPAEGVEVIRFDARSTALRPRSIGVALSSRQSRRLANLEWIVREAVTTTVVERLIRERHVDLVISFMVTSSLFVPRLKDRFGVRVKFATTVFGEIVEREAVIQRSHAFYRSVLSRSDQLLATSAYCASLVRLLDFDPAAVRVIYIGTDVARFAAATDRPTALDLPAGNPTLLFVGRFHPEMGLDVVLEMAPDLIARHPGGKLLLVGASGSLSNAAAALAARYPANVIVRQNVPFKDLPAYYAAADVLLAPTRDRHACMGVSIKEAMAAGKPIIATRSGGIPEAIVEGETGILLDFSRGDRVMPVDLLTAVTSLVDDANGRRRMGESARRRALELFDSRHCLGQHLSTVRELIG